ncbi:MAG: YheU family protein [Planctomycetes bacterium]|nr:YheU family protein [Planctomycetota bacterium]
MAVPHNELRPETLRALIEEFVTRDGAVHGHMETPLEIQMEAVRRQLEAGTIQIVFDEQSETWTIVPVDPRDRSKRALNE